MASVKKGRGGARIGAGRPKGSGGDLRHHRVAILLTDDEIAKLRAWAAERNRPVGTVAYEVVARALKRR